MYPGGPHCIEGLKSRKQDFLLIVTVPRFSGLKAQWEIQELCSRGFAGLEDVQRTAKNERGYLSAFKVTGNQTHGLMANGSQRYQQQQVDSLGFEGILQLRDQLFANASVGIDTTHTGEVVIGEVTNDTLLFEPGQRLNG